MKRKLVALSMAALMALSMTVSAAAAPAANDPEIQPRRELCGNCGKMTLFTQKIHVYDKGPVYTPCPHLGAGDDWTWYEVWAFQAQCSSCGFLSDPWGEELVFIRQECHGHG